MTETWLGVGRVDLPAGWEVRPQFTLYEPPPVTEVAEGAAPPRANLVVSQIAASFEDVESAVEAVFEELAQAMPGLERGETSEIVFADGVGGYYVDVAFFVRPEQRIIQRHAVRLDADTLTHFVLSVDVSQQERLAALDQVLRSYRAGPGVEP